MYFCEKSLKFEHFLLLYVPCHAVFQVLHVFMLSQWNSISFVCQLVKLIIWLFYVSDIACGEITRGSVITWYRLICMAAANQRPFRFGNNFFFQCWTFFQLPAFFSKIHIGNTNWFTVGWTEDCFHHKTLNLLWLGHNSIENPFYGFLKLTPVKVGLWVQ